LLHDRWDGGISNGDSIEWAEVVDDAEGTSISFYDAELSRAVSSVGRFIHTRHYFVTDNFNELVVETWQDGDILVDPRHMRNYRDVDWGEEILPKLSFFSSIHEAFFLLSYQVMHQLLLFWPQETVGIELQLLIPFLCVSEAGNKVGGCIGNTGISRESPMMLRTMWNSSGSCVTIGWILSSAFLYFLLYTTPGFFSPISV
jgi:hypothetical protein